MVVHDIPCIPVQGHIIKQHKLVSQGTLSNGFPGRTDTGTGALSSCTCWGWVTQGQGTASPACPALYVGSSLEARIDYLDSVVARGQREESTVWDLLARREIYNSEGLAPARSHQDQGSKAASWSQSHPDDAIVQNHRTVSLGREDP